jgi:hypothetical protein
MRITIILSLFAVGCGDPSWSLRLDPGDYLEAPSPSLGGSEVSILLWFKVPSEPTERWRGVDLVRWRGCGPMAIPMSQTLWSSASVHGEGCSKKRRDGTVSLPTDRWAHMAVTYDGETLAVYGDGLVRLSVKASDAITLTDGASMVRMGEQTASTPQPQPIYLAGVEIWSHAATGAEVQEAMYTWSDEPYVEAQWRMRDGGGDSLVDDSGSELHGLIHNAKWVEDTPVQ